MVLPEGRSLSFLLSDVGFWFGDVGMDCLSRKRGTGGWLLTWSALWMMVLVRVPVMNFLGDYRVEAFFCF